MEGNPLTLNSDAEQRATEFGQEYAEDPRER